MCSLRPSRVKGWDSSVGAGLDDELAWDAGAAYIFQRDHGGADAWGQVAKIQASDAQASDEFGHAVAISGDMAIVGAPLFLHLIYKTRRQLA